jgi:hypothetical protein
LGNDGKPLLALFFAGYSCYNLSIMKLHSRLRIISRLMSAILVATVAASGFFYRAGSAFAGPVFPVSGERELVIGYRSGSIKVVSVQADELGEVASRLSADPDVAYVEPNLTYQAAIIPSDTFYS